MGTAQRIFACPSDEEEDEQQLQQLYRFLDDTNNYQKPYNGASFNNPPFLQISSSSSNSSLSPNTIYVPGADLNLQLWSDQYHYSSSEESNGNEDEGLHYNKQMDGISNVPSLDCESVASTNTFDVDDYAFFSIEKDEKEDEEVEEEKRKRSKKKKKKKKKKIWLRMPSKNIYICEKIKNKKKVEEEKATNCCVRVEEKWITHYNRSHKILLVGEGDFSFSTSLALAFGSAFNMIATSLDLQEFLKKNYGNAMVNINNLTSRGCKVVHGIDATQMASYVWLRKRKFDRIIYNFPFAGFFYDLSRDEQLRKHRRLVNLFLKNAKQMISENGEIHITHKTNGYHREWNLENLASSHGLTLIEAAKFNQLDYPGYNTKYGFGGDGNFDCNPAKTYKFGQKK